MRGGKPVPEGWLIVWRGKAEAGHETAPRPTTVSPKGVEDLMAEARQLIHDQGECIARLKAQLEDARAIARVIELAKASTVEEWDHGTLLRDVLERLDRKPREHRQVSRAKVEVDHYPTWKGPLP